MKFLGKVNEFLVKLLMKIQPPALRYFVLVILAFVVGAGSIVTIGTPLQEDHGIPTWVLLTTGLGAFALIIDYFVIAYNEEKAIESEEKKTLG
jgi:hypothetical protein